MVRKVLEGGWSRIGVVGVACAGLFFLTFSGQHNVFRNMMHWVEFLSPMPGLSGLALLFLVPVFFLVAILVVSWVVLGFRGNPS
jgi:hypothetical protein